MDFIWNDKMKTKARRNGEHGRILETLQNNVSSNHRGVCCPIATSAEFFTFTWSTTPSHYPPPPSQTVPPSPPPPQETYSAGGGGLSPITWIFFSYRLVLMFGMKLWDGVGSPPILCNLWIDPSIWACLWGDLQRGHLTPQCSEHHLLGRKSLARGSEIRTV